MHIAVATCAHRGNDARIAHRQVAALLAAGHDVTLIAPPPSPFVDPRLTHLEVRRAVGRRRFRSWWDVRRALLRLKADVLIIHDPELLWVVRPSCADALVWDVHEDFESVIVDRPYIPRWAGPLVRLVVRGVVVRAQHRFHILVAEASYISMFSGAMVVPNTTLVASRCPPPSRPDCVVYVGRISTSRGLHEMIELGRLGRGRYSVELTGAVDANDEVALRTAVQNGDVFWCGYQPNDEALRGVEGALVGLSLLHRQPNFEHSVPTKIIEYASRGVPAIASRLERSVELVDDIGGFVVDVEDISAAHDVIIALQDNPTHREQLGYDVHASVLDRYNWTVDGPRFVAFIEGLTAPLK